MLECSHSTPHILNAWCGALGRFPNHLRHSWLDLNHMRWCSPQWQERLCSNTWMSTFEFTIFQCLVCSLRALIVSYVAHIWLHVNVVQQGMCACSGKRICEETLERRHSNQHILNARCEALEHFRYMNVAPWIVNKDVQHWKQELLINNAPMFMIESTILGCLVWHTRALAVPHVAQMSRAESHQSDDNN